MQKGEKKEADRLEDQFKKIVENNFQNGEIKDIAKMYKELQ
jgi:RNA polymerase-interacting CarD/CdnL/TRCF family regulator